MGHACDILASTTTDLLQVMGSSQTPHIYICTSTSVYVPPAAPLVCASAATAYAVGRWAQTDVGKRLIDWAAGEGCEVVVRVSRKGADIAIVKGAEVETKVDNLIADAKKKYSSLNSFDGIHWLMRSLTGG